MVNVGRKLQFVTPASRTVSGRYFPSSRKQVQEPFSTDSAARKGNGNCDTVARVTVSPDLRAHE
jgi:hypothetical protein